jgi:hypothetical protein
MTCSIEKKISGTTEKKYYLIKNLKDELEKLGINAEIYLVISEKERNDFFKNPDFNGNTKSFGLFGKPFSLFGNYGTTSPINYSNLTSFIYNGDEITMPYKNFESIFESLFHLKKNEYIQKEKEIIKEKLDSKIEYKGGDKYNEERIPSEEGNPEEGNPDEGNTDEQYPEEGNTDEQYPDEGNTDEQYPDEGNQQEGNPDEGNPDEGNPEEGNPEEGNPEEGNPEEIQQELEPTDDEKIAVGMWINLKELRIKIVKK